jgi:hypothetical protein
MIEKGHKKTQPDDPEQSRRFLEAACDIEAAGGLSPTEAEVEIVRVLQSAQKPTAKSP